MTGDHATTGNHGMTGEYSTTDGEANSTDVDPHSASVDPRSASFDPHSTDADPHSTGVDDRDGRGLHRSVRRWHTPKSDGHTVTTYAPPDTMDSVARNGYEDAADGHGTTPREN